MVTPLEEAIGFLDRFGFFRVILPFLLVFTVVYALLEKTKIFGTQKHGDKELPRKNMNAMVAFVIGLLVVSARDVVTALQTSLPNVVMLIIVILAVLIGIGMLWSGEKEFNLFEKLPKLSYVLIAVILFVLLAIFLDSFGVLNNVFDFFNKNYDRPVVTSIGLLIVVAIIMWLIIREGKTGGEK